MHACASSIYIYTSQSLDAHTLIHSLIEHILDHLGSRCAHFRLSLLRSIGWQLIATACTCICIRLCIYMSMSMPKYWN